jgi:Bacterial SH3 domain
VKSEVQILSPRFSIIENPRMRRILALLGCLAALIATEVTALAEQGEIGGIEKVYLRGGPNTEDPAVGVLSAGDRVTILGSAGSWANVQTQDGKVGYVNHRYVLPLAATAGAEPATIPVAPTPVAAPTQVLAPPTPEAAVAAEGAALSNELAELRAEVGRLREQVREEKQKAAEGSLAAPAEPGAAVTPTPASAGDQAVGVFAVAGLSLFVGWALGSVFSRRRSRSHRPRLRI